MLFTSWLRLVRPASRTAVSRRRPTTRLTVEVLEDRCVPSYQQINLTGFQPGMAPHVDPNLNGWGMDYAPNGAFCVANTATGTATFYDAKGKPLPTVITIPAAPSQPFGPVGSPTGIAYNSTTDFVISKDGKSAPARFLFDTLDGVICGWNPDVDPTTAIIVVDNSGEHPFPASYTGLALGHDKHGRNVLYAADSGSSPTVSNNRIDMFDGRFHSAGSFTDRNVAAQYPGNTVFQVEDVDDKLFVTFAGFTAPFGGVVDVFDGDGKLLTPNHFAANAPGQGPLENPWGIVKAPAHFGPFSNDILIGNVEGDGNINAFDPASGKFLGSLRYPDGTPIAITGLWDLTFGGGNKINGKPDELFFDAGPNAADFAGNGLFGVILSADQKHTAAAAVPDPAKLTLGAGEVQPLLAADVQALNPGSTIIQVAFYVDSNNNGVLDSGDTRLVSSSTYSKGTWTLTFSTTGWTSGSHKLFAQALDSYGVLSDPLGLDLQVI